MDYDPLTIRSREAWPEQCERCRRWVPRIHLRYQLQRVVTPAGENRLPYARYSSDGWTCDASDEGLYSQSDSGYYLDITPQAYPTADTTNRRGTQTWGGDGRYIMAEAVDWSALTSIVVATMCGFSHEEQNPGGDLVVGIRSGGVDHELAEWAVLGDRLVWGKIDTADLTDAADCKVYFEMTVDTAGAMWWVDWHEAFGNVSAVPAPRGIVATTGTAVSSRQQTSGERTVLVCNDCLDPTLDIIDEGSPTPAPPPTIRQDVRIK